MKVRDIPKFRLCAMDKRLNGADFNRLMKIWLRRNKMTTWKEKCGVDADGKNGVMIDMYELEHTEKEKEDIIEILYEYFLQGIVKGVKEIKLDEVKIEVYIEDYIEELVEKVVNDINLDYEDIDFISKELNDSQILNRWINNKKGG